MVPARRADPGRSLPALVIVLSVLAWVALWLWDRSPSGRYLSHHDLDAVRADPRLALVFIAGWVVMVVAMMLPTHLRLIAMFQRQNSRYANTNRIGALLIAGYLIVWTFFGVVVYANDWLIHQAVHAFPWLHRQAWAFSALILVSAGVYQFTSLKRACLKSYRSGRDCVVEFQQGDAATPRSLLLGMRHGFSCIGCCWALMLLMFAVGAGNLGWMLVLAAIMAVEKNMPWGQRISAPLGIMLVVWGVTLLLLGAPAIEHPHVP